MWRNYLASALHNLVRNRAYAAINIAGLALGLTAVLLIAVYVRGEYSFERMFPDYARTYRISMEATQPGRVPIRIGPSTTANAAAALELDFPEVEMATRMRGGFGALRQGRRRDHVRLPVGRSRLLPHVPGKSTCRRSERDTCETRRHRPHTHSRATALRPRRRARRGAASQPPAQPNRRRHHRRSAMEHASRFQCGGIGPRQFF